ncbi:GBS Bsp-like repeat-containing protein [Enterococcus cecorum]|uniref:GBS Bsp-like repeat-containing protein n=1 Tax=Enterococcus cecorum TaxID=44008 RepID=UPI00148C245A|nr:GBS Bsp-like repeat-containing protein [Enterococcus cecorum]
MKKSKKWLTFSVCAATLSLFLATNSFADETQTTNTSTSSTVTLSSSSSAPETESTETSAMSTETTTTQSSSANSADEVAAQTAVQVVKPIEGTIKNVNQENGTYDVVVKVNENVQSGIKNVFVPIWSDAQQKDIKWYEAKLQADGTWIVHMNFSEHQYYRATYHTHVYVYSNDNKHDIKTVLDDTTIEPRETKLSAKIQNVNTSTGSYDVIVYGSSSSGIHHVKVPIWSAKDQSDIKWYDAVKQADGSYLVYMNIANHKYHCGIYHTHVYMYNNDHTGKAIVVNDINLPDVQTKLEAEINNVNIAKGTYDVVINGQINSGIREILVPIWSSKSQNDIKWYKASKQTDGTYVVHMNIANHKYNRGTYTTHVYMYGNNGKQHGMVVGNTALPDVNTKLDAKIQNVNQDKGSYDVVIKGQIDSGVREILVPIWSDKNQKDIKWYKASKQADGSYLVHMNIANHKYNRGTYTTHVYMYGNNGKQHGMVVGNTVLPDIHTKLDAEIKNINQDKGSFDVVIKGQIDSGIREILVPIWSDKNQKDIKWYEANKQADGSYVVHMNISNHKYNRGTYTTHVYMYGNNGKQHGMVVGNTALPDIHTKLDAEIKNINQNKGSYDVVIKGQIDSGIKEILVPIWSSKNQNDIKWYKASKQVDGSYVVHMNIANHKYNRGTYTTHVYMYGNNGKQHGMVVGNTSLPNIHTKLEAEIKNINQDKGSYDVIVKGQIDSGIREILVPIWSDKKQNDIKWYKASKQADGSYIVHMNFGNHQFNTGMYNTHVYMYGNNGKYHGIVLPLTKVSANLVTDDLSAEIINVNQNKGTFDVVVYTRSNSGVKNVRIPVWHNSNQSDLVWYSATKVGTNKFKASINVKNHHYNNGKYSVHAYMINNLNKEYKKVIAPIDLTGTYNRIEMTNVPWISQYRPVFAPWGCASAAMAMLIESRGIHVDLKYAQDTLPMYPANKDGQLGDVYTGAGFGFVIKPSGLVRHAHKWTNAVYDISGSSTQKIIDTILNGQPVLYYGFSGYQVPGDYNRNHCKVIVGYKDGKFKVHDPLYMRASDGPGSRGKNKTYSRGAIHWITVAQFNQEYAGNAITIK